MKEWKAPEKEAQKMTRDGAVSVNLVTGETTYPSNRTPEQDHSASGDTAGAAGKVVDRAELHREQAAAKKKRRKQRRAYREGEAAASRPSSRLQFSEADRAVPELQGAIRKSDKAADRLDAAKAAVPSKPPSPQHTNPLSRPIQEAGAAIHGKVREVEQENSGVQSGHLGERGIEKAVGYGNRRVQNWRAERKLKPWQDAAKAEQAAVKANADFYYRKAVAENPQLASNPVSRLWQKRKLQKQYAAAYRAAGKTAQAGKTAEATAKAAKKTAQESKRTVLFVKRHWKGALIVGGIGLLLVMLLGSLQSCSSMFGGGVSNIMASSYLSEDSDMLAAEEAYCAKEDELREYLDTYDQALHGAYKQVSENDDDPVWTAVLRTRKHKYNFHHGCVADCKSADTHEGECIGKVAQDNLKQFKDTLYDKHAFFFWHSICFFLDQFTERLFEADQDQRNEEHNHQNTGCRDGMTCHK